MPTYLVIVNLFESKQEGQGRQGKGEVFVSPARTAIKYKMQMTVLKGKVVSGLGNFSYWIEKLQEHYLRKTGMNLFPGTLNIQLPQPYNLPKNVIRLEKEDYGGTVSVSIVPCKIFGRDAFILRTDKNDSGNGPHPKTIIEIACDVKLREKYSLKDGDTIEVEVLE